MKTSAIAAGLAVVLFAGAAAAQSAMTLDAYVTQANRIPMNPTAILRSDTRRLIGVTNESFAVIRRDIRADRAAGRRPAACPPEKVQMNPRQLLGFLNAIPQPRRARMSVVEGLSAWMADRYPCAS